MSDYLNSTHNKKWIFTKENLEKHRMDKYENFKFSLARFLAKQFYHKQLADPKAPKDLLDHATQKLLQNKGADNIVGGIEVLALSSENLLLNSLISRIIKLTEKMPDKIKNTAITIFKRFYIDHSIYVYNPHYLHLTCIILAFKIEEFNETATGFLSKFPEIKPESNIR